MPKSLSGTYFILVALLLSYQFGSAQQREPKFSVQPNIAYQTMALSWSIAGNMEGKKPNVLSELKWQKLRGPQLGLNFHYQFSPQFGAGADFSFQRITSGKVNDSDYASDHRQDRFYNENFESNQGHELSFKFALDYRLLQKDNFQLRPFLAYALYRQFVVMRDGPEVKRSEPLNSNYHTTWQGLELGTKLVLNWRTLAFHTDLSASWLAYRAKAQWNLIPEFAQPLSFQHRSGAYALQAKLAISYPVYRHLNALLYAGTRYAYAWPGVDEAFYVARATAKTQLNEVKLTSYQFGAGLKYSF